MKSGRKNRWFWGWYVVAGSFLMLTLTYGSRYSYGIFVQPLSQSMGWSRSAVSLVASLHFFFFAVGGIYSGRLIDRIAPRWVVSFGAIASAVGVFVAAYADSLALFCLGYGVLFGIGASCMGQVVGNSTVGKWFHRKRGLAIGIGSSGVSFGTVLFAPITGWIVKDFGWQAGFTLFGFLLLVPGLLIAQTLLRRSTPEAYGLHPDGSDRVREEPVSALSNSTDAPTLVSAPAKSVREIFRDSRFWTIAACHGTAAAVAFLCFVHQVPYALDHGIDRIAAASSLGALGFAGFLGQFFFGWLSDRLKDPKHAVIPGYVSMALGLLILIMFPTTGGLFAYAVTFGFGYGCLGPMLPIMSFHRFGRQAMGGTYGLVNSFVITIGCLGPYLGGVIYDVCGSYEPVWSLGVILLLASSAGIELFLKRT